MSQTRSHALTSIFILGVLTVGFFFASRVVFSQIHNSVEQAIGTPTPTVTPVPTQAAPLAVSSATMVAGRSKTPLPVRRHALTPTPAATSTPTSSTARVVVGTSNSPSSATTDFPGNTGMFYCMISLPNLPLSTPITFKWVSLPSGSVIFAYTGTYADTYKDSYLDGPLQPGSDRCDVYAPQNGQLQILGSASFTVR
jgi:hypothetical protein